MKKHLYIYGTLVAAFLLYNFFFQIGDDRINTALNILFASIIFGYISWMAFVMLKKMRKK